MQHKFHCPGLYSLVLLFFIIFPSCQPEEPEPFPTVPSEPVELAFEEAIKGTWYGLEYYIEYFDEDGELMHKEVEKVFIKSISMDGEMIIYKYESTSPDWKNSYTTPTVDGKNYILIPGFPEVHVVELTRKLMVWEETTNGGTFDDNDGNIQVQADHQIRTFKFHR